MTTQQGHSLALIAAYGGLREIYVAFERAAREVAASRGAPLCVEGCGKCCQHNTPYLWDLEAHHIISTVLGDGTLSPTLDRCEAWLQDRHRGLTVYGHHLDMRSGDARTKVLREVAVAAATPCPFLEENRCAIHEARPLACRAYGVTRLPSQQECPAPLGPGETESRRGIYRNPALASAVQRFLGSLSAEWRASYFLPTDIVRLARPVRYFEIAERAATAKLVAMPTSPAVLWQEQLEQVWRDQGLRGPSVMTASLAT